MQLFSADIHGWVSVADVFICLYKDFENSFWLDRETHPTEPFSVIGASTESRELGADALDWLAEHLNGYPADAFGDLAASLPFSWRPGVVGQFDYEFGVQSVLGGHSTATLARFQFVDRAIVFDHEARRMYFIGLFDDQASFDSWYHAALLRLALVGGGLGGYLMDNDQVGQFSEVSLRRTRDEYLSMIDEAKAAIARGDFYQICLTNQVSMRHNLDPLAVFLRLREQNPSPYSTYLRFGDLAVVSSSPEQFLQISRDGVVTSRPIKGTRPRSQDPEADAASAAELAANTKERAENLMIVDLMRNDLGRVCQVGSVDVPKLFEVETYATVHQLVSTITGRLNQDSHAIDAILACFPAGSMTGAPKHSAMTKIKALEGGPRGVYSGAIGYLGADGSADFGMVIRTLVFVGDRLEIGVGGGITIDSDPAAEFEEIRIKAGALLAAIGAKDPWC